MTELKTLKDLTFNSNIILEGKQIQLVWEPKLKAEAIKWVKELEKCGDDGEWNVGGYEGWNESYECFESQEIADFLKFFFNLTEEDLE